MVNGNLYSNNFVNTNSKYKEVDFTDSDADDYFQDM